MIRNLKLACLLINLTLLNACGHAVEDASQESPAEKFITVEYHVKVSVTNLVGSGLRIRNDSADDILINENKIYEFKAALLDGESYNISILESPVLPNQVCAVNPQSGVITKSDVIIDLNCTTTQYSLGGTVEGLTGRG